jgi:hypothetical protein
MNANRSANVIKVNCEHRQTNCASVKSVGLKANLQDFTFLCPTSVGLFCRGQFDEISGLVLTHGFKSVNMNQVNAELFCR